MRKIKIAILISIISIGLLVLVSLWLNLHGKKALEEGERGIALGPNSADAHAMYAQTLIFAGESAKGVSLAEKALRMNPFPPSHYFNALAIGYRLLGDYERAIQASEKAINIEPMNLRARISLIVSYAMSGREIEAQAQAQAGHRPQAIRKVVLTE